MISLKTLAATACLAVLGTHTMAACAATPIEQNWAIEPGDIRVSGEFVQKTVRGKKVRFGNAFEHYKQDGSYAFFDGSRRHHPDGYVFYADGSRCLNYAHPRYDMYVVRDQKLVLINVQGERHIAKLTR